MTENKIIPKPKIFEIVFLGGSVKIHAHTYIQACNKFESDNPDVNYEIWKVSEGKT